MVRLEEDFGFPAPIVEKLKGDIVTTEANLTTKAMGAE